MAPFVENLRSTITWTWIVTSIFGILMAGLLLALTENVKELLKQRGGNTLLVRSLDTLPKKLQDQFRWERLRRLWWLWAIFGLSGGIALALWLAPLIIHAPTSENDARQVELSHMQQQLSGLQSQLAAAREQRDNTQQKLTAAEKAHTSAEERAHTAETRTSSLEAQIRTLQSKVAAPSAPRWSKTDILRLQKEVFAIHEVLNTADQKLRGLQALATDGIAIVARNGENKSIEMLNSYLETAQHLLDVITQKNPIEYRYDWKDLEPLTPDSRNLIGVFIAILNQYRAVLLKPGDFQTNIL